MLKSTKPKEKPKANKGNKRQTDRCLNLVIPEADPETKIYTGSLRADSRSTRRRVGKGSKPRRGALKLHFD